MAERRLLTVAVTKRTYTIVEVEEKKNEEKTMCLVTLITPFGGITRAYPIKDVCIDEGTYDSDGLRFVVDHCTDSEYEAFKAKAKCVDDSSVLLQSLLDMVVSEVG